jgi:hypothetical protein
VPPDEAEQSRQLEAPPNRPPVRSKQQWLPRSSPGAVRHSRDPPDYPNDHETNSGYHAAFAQAVKRRFAPLYAQLVATSVAIAQVSHRGKTPTNVKLCRYTSHMSIRRKHKATSVETRCSFRTRRRRVAENASADGRMHDPHESHESFRHARKRNLNEIFYRGESHATHTTHARNQPVPVEVNRTL